VKTFISCSRERRNDDVFIVEKLGESEQDLFALQFRHGYLL
jgi:hypothetical protein